MLRIFIWSVSVFSLHRNQVQYPNCLLLYNGTGGSSLSGMSSSELRLFNRDFLLKKNPLIYLIVMKRVSESKFQISVVRVL